MRKGDDGEETKRWVWSEQDFCGGGRGRSVCVCGLNTTGIFSLISFVWNNWKMLSLYKRMKMRKPRAFRLIVVTKAVKQWKKSKRIRKETVLIHIRHSRPIMPYHWTPSRRNISPFSKAKRYDSRSNICICMCTYRGRRAKERLRGEKGKGGREGKLRVTKWSIYSITYNSFLY